jgi:uncharacterized phage protein (TIGR01671 family)
MREILFRGKRVDNGEWVYGYYFSSERDIEDGFVWRDIPQIQQRYGDHYQYFDVIPETIGQYTGLTDKNGKKIFEGDIVEGFLSLHPDRKIHQVVYEDNGFYYRDEDGVGWHPDHITCVEVIGNIFDNPELLESEDK